MTAIETACWQQLALTGFIIAISFASVCLTAYLVFTAAWLPAIFLLIARRQLLDWLERVERRVQERFRRIAAPAK